LTGGISAVILLGDAGWEIHGSLQKPLRCWGRRFGGYVASLDALTHLCRKEEGSPDRGPVSLRLAVLLESDAEGFASIGS